MREVAEMLYLFERPLMLSSEQTERELGLESTPLDDVLAGMVGRVADRRGLDAEQVASGS